ncbi:MAG: nitrate/nitrite transporter [Halopenitus sp.]
MSRWSQLVAERHLLGTIVGLWLLAAAAHHYVIAPASVLSTISTDLGVGPSTGVWLVSAVLAAWTVTSAVVGGAIDRFGDIRAIGVATGVLVVAVVWGWRAGRRGAFAELLVTRLLAGAAIATAWTASANVIGGAVVGDRRGTVVGIYLTSAPAGFAVGQWTVPRITAAVGWPASFLLGGVGVLAGFGLFRVAVRGVDVQPGDSGATLRGNVGDVLQHRAVRYGCVMAFAGYSYYLFVNSWLPSYLASEFALSPTLSGLLTALFPAMGVLSRVGGGFVSDRLLGRRRIPVLQFSFLVAIPLVVAIATTETLAVIVASLLAAGFVIQLTFGVVWTYVTESVAADVSGTALALLGTAGMAGAFSAPIVAGTLIDVTGTYATAFTYAGVLALGGLALSLLAPESD